MKAGKIGGLAVALASACCVGPLLLAALGLGSLGLGAALGKNHWVLQGAAVVGLTLAWYFFLREKRRMYALASEMRNERRTRFITGGPSDQSKRQKRFRQMLEEIVKETAAFLTPAQSSAVREVLLEVRGKGPSAEGRSSGSP